MRLWFEHERCRHRIDLQSWERRLIVKSKDGSVVKKQGSGMPWSRMETLEDEQYPLSLILGQSTEEKREKDLNEFKSRKEFWRNDSEDRVPKRMRPEEPDFTREWTVKEWNRQLFKFKNAWRLIHYHYILADLVERTVEDIKDAWKYVTKHDEDAKTMTPESYIAKIREALEQWRTPGVTSEAETA